MKAGIFSTGTGPILILTTYASLGDLKQSNDLRVLDYDGHHVFYNFSIDEFGQPDFHEA